MDNITTSNVSYESPIWSTIVYCDGEFEVVSKPVENAPVQLYVWRCKKCEQTFHGSMAPSYHMSVQQVKP